MESKPGEGSSIGVPLLLEEQHGVDEYSSGDQHSNNGGTTTFFSTCFNTLNSLSGIGILSVPYALSSGGWLSLILLFAIAIATFYTSLLIKRCMDLDPNIKTYPDIGGLAFGDKGRLVVSVFMNLELYLVATSFLILEGDNLHNLFPIEGFEISGIRIGGKQMFVMVIGLIILPTVLPSDMSVLSCISATGVLASVIILVAVIWAGTYDGIGFQGKGKILNWNGIPSAISLYAFCYCAHPVLPTLYSSMRNQKQFSKVLVLCFLICTITYASMAVIGYLMFGSEVQSQITLNLPIGNMSSKVAIYTTLVNPIAKYALMVTPIVNIIENTCPRWCNRRPTSLLVRITLVISTVIVALAIPFFGYLMSLVGAFLSLTASVILPCLCYLKISETYRRFGLELVVTGAILSVGILIAVVGTYTSLADLIKQF